MPRITANGINNTARIVIIMAGDIISQKIATAIKLTDRTTITYVIVPIIIVPEHP